MDKKLKLYILLGFLGVLILLGISFTTDLNYSDSDGLNYGQKKKDAEYLVRILEEVYPYYKLEKDKGNIGSNSDIVRNISKTKTDEEFFKAIYNTLNNIKEGRVHIYPQQLNERDIIIFDEKLGEDKIDYITRSYEGQRTWQQMIEKLQGSAAYIMPEVYCSYFEGDYYVHASQKADIYPGDKIVKIEGMDVDSYVAKNFNDRFSGVNIKIKDAKRNKEVLTGMLINLKDKNSKLKLTICSKEGQEREVEIGAFNETKPWLNMRQSSEGTAYDVTKGKGFLNVFEDGKIVALNFGMGMDSINNEEDKQRVYKAIDNSEYLILDVRTMGGGPFLMEIIKYISNEDISVGYYNIMRKNKYNDRVIKEVETQNAATFQQKFSINNSSIEDKFPPSQYYRATIAEENIEGLGKYNGKVFIFSNMLEYSPIDSSLVKALKQNQNIAFIANNEITVGGEYYSEFTPKIILPNSNLALSVQNSWLVDYKGEPMEKQYIKPNFIIEENKDLYISLLKGDIDPFYYDNYRKYTDKDEYYKKFLECVKIK